MFSLNLSWNFENGAALDRTVRYILCLQAGVGLYLGVGFYHTLRLGSDVGFLLRLTVPAESNQIQTGCLHMHRFVHADPFIEPLFGHPVIHSIICCSSVLSLVLLCTIRSNGGSKVLWGCIGSTTVFS